MINNKGAMELSINTIVIIVIGVTLLSLGLIFVKGVFDKLDGQSDQIFEGGENEISKIANHDQKLSVKQQVNVKQGADAVFKVWVVNFEDDVSDFTVEIEPSSSNPFGERVNIQLLKIIPKYFPIIVCNIFSFFPFFCSSLFHFVLTCICIRSQMSYISNIHNMFNIISKIF